MKLSVIKQFAEHQVGDVIADADKVAALLKSEFAHFVVKVPTNTAGLPAAESVTARPESA